MEAQPRVSVVIAAHQAAATLGRALESALAQSLRALEVIVVDDASSDGGADLVRQRAEEDPRVRLIVLDQNGGPSRARNRALDVARGEWIAVLDADDAFAPERLARLTQIADTSGADLVADNLRYVEAGSGRSLGTAMPPEGEERFVGAAEFVLRNLFSPRSFKLGYLKPLIRRRLLAQHAIRYRDDMRIGEDFQLYLDCLLAGGRFVLTPRPMYDYTQTPGSQSRRLAIADLERLLAANAEAESRAGAADLKRALAARGRDLEREREHMRFAMALKAGRPVRAVSRLASRPEVWPRALRSASESLTKRLRRFRQPGAAVFDLAHADRAGVIPGR